MTSRRAVVLRGLAFGAACVTKVDRAALAQGEPRQITAEHPLVISNPVLGLLNLLGAAGTDLLARDESYIGALFPVVRTSTTDVPRCSVLFLYCDLDATGHVVGTALSLRDVIKDAGARVAVVASAVDPKLANQQFGDALGNHNDWPANLVVTFDRKGEAFGWFFRKLFSRMQVGTSMMKAWADLAPQGPGLPDDNPQAMFLPEVGHIAFGRPKR